MKPSVGALSLFVALATTYCPYALAFTPTTFINSRAAATTTGAAATWSPVVATTTSSMRQNMSLNMAGFLGMEDDDDDDEDDEDDDDDDIDLSSSRSSLEDAEFASIGGVTFDPYDPNPLIKPRPSRLFQKIDKNKSAIPDDELVQKMTDEERQENLNVIRQIKKNDLPDLRLRKDYAGWQVANNDLKRRMERDPWFNLNERLMDVIQYSPEDVDQIKYLNNLIDKLGGPPSPDIKPHKRGYTVYTEIYDMGLTPSRANAIYEEEIREDRIARGKAMIAERKKNEEIAAAKYAEESKISGYLREEIEAKKRREKTMRRLLAEIEEDNEKKAERAKEILGKLPNTFESRTEAYDNALKRAQQDVKRIKQIQQGKLPSDLDKSGSSSSSSKSKNMSGKSGADKAREKAEQEASGGRPRLPGDEDVKLGELEGSEDDLNSGSTTITGPLQVEVTSSYNKDQSDEPMRKHCFQYTIRITNNSPTDTIQLLGRRFEIQTVGSSMKDVVAGEGVTGRQPILKPGEVFEYNSMAPLSVRPIGTTIIAARMKGEYKYIVLEDGQETATPEQVKNGGDQQESAELGMFHFIFPEEQRVKPFTSLDDDDDDEDEDEDDEDEDEDDDDDDDVAAESRSSSSTTSTPASTLPGDDDMKTGDITLSSISDESDTVTDNVRVQVSSSYRPERSDNGQDKHCFAYNIRITNEDSKQSIQLVSRRFEIQTIGSTQKDVVQGPGVTGRQPILKPGESFEYTSTAPLSVKPILEKTPVVARMQGEYNFVLLSESDNTTPISSTPLKAILGMFHFILPALDIA